MKFLGKSPCTALRMWGISGTPVLETSGLNKQTWKVGDRHWLAADCLSATDVWSMVEEVLSRPELQYLALPRAVATPAGELFPHQGGQVWRLTLTVDGVVPDPASVEHLDAVAVGLARLHQAMEALPSEYGRHSKSRQAYIQRAGELVGQQLLPYTEEEARIINTGLEFVQEVGEIDPHHQLIHGDPSYPNLRLTSGGVLGGAIDWEGVCWESPLHDLAVVGQTVLYRSGWADLRSGLERLLQQYRQAGGRTYSVQQLLLYVLIIKLESIAHHGDKLIHGQGDVDLVRSQAGKIALAIQLLGDDSNKHQRE